MERPDYLNKYIFDWELMDVMLGGRSALDSKYFIGPTYQKNHADSFLRGYGLNPDDPISKAELFGNFQEALQFIKRYFLKEGNESIGLDLKIPPSFYRMTDISELFLLATQKPKEENEELRLWAEVILKIIHTILHVDKDLRSNYFGVIQTQIFDRFYRYIYRDSEDQLFLGERSKSREGELSQEIPLEDFETKSKKSRDSVIIKLLHKVKNVAEELFDRIGIRFVTRNKFDTLRVIKFLLEKSIVIPHNIKPSRSINSLIDLKAFKNRHGNLIKDCIRLDTGEEEFLKNLEEEANRSLVEDTEFERNVHTSQDYRAIQFTGRQLIRYKNPFMEEFNNLRKMARKNDGCEELAKKILSMDISLISRDISFFYPYEVQIVDLESYKENTEGEASHQEYKKSQQISAMKRLFEPLLKHKKIEINFEDL